MVASRDSLDENGDVIPDPQIRFGYDFGDNVTEKVDILEIAKKRFDYEPSVEAEKL